MAGLAVLQFGLMPEEWLPEVRRFFKRNDIDKSRYAQVALNALACDPVLRQLLALVPAPAENQAPIDPEGAARVAGSGLFRILLRDTVIGHSGVEAFLTRLRAAMLLRPRFAARLPLAFVCDLALQCFNNEFVYSVQSSEARALASLARDLQVACARRRTGKGIALKAAIYAAYRPLHRLAFCDTLYRLQGGPAYRRLLRRTIDTVRREKVLQSAIPSLGKIADRVSIRVRSQYEDHPYPRWLQIDRMPATSLHDWFRSDFPDPALLRALPRTARILVAGCGSGAETLALAAALPAARIVAVDLSRASLAYACRNGEDMGIANVEFIHADLLALDAMAGQFDLVCSLGVLHHMRRPQEGMVALRRMVRPGGLILLGVYSAAGRTLVNQARRTIRRLRLRPVESDIRAFRKMVFTAGAASKLKGLFRYPDFFSMSGCRDLLFHVREVQYRVPDLLSAVQRSGLTALAPPRGAGLYRLWCRRPTRSS